MTTTTAVTIFHRVPGTAGFDAWPAKLRGEARQADGWMSDSASVHDDPRLDWELSVTFDCEELLHRWLDSPQRAALLEDGQQQGFWRRSGDLVLVAGAEAPPGVSAFRHVVAGGRDGEFLAAQIRLADACQGFPGYEGTTVLAADDGGQWTSLVRFRTAGQLSSWLRSQDREDELAELRSSLTKDFSAISSTTPFGTTVRIQDGQAALTPNWKSAIMVLLVLYPTVMLLSRFFGPVLDRLGAAPWLALWVSQIVSICAMQWWLMPTASRPFRRWLDPVDGAGPRVSLRGAAVIVALYIVTLAVFATVKDLQFWDYMD